jgi:hypothetical protein
MRCAINLDTVYPFIPTLATGTTGFSKEADFIKKENKNNLSQLHKSFALGLGGVFIELDNVQNECSVENWDGYGALPINKTSANNTEELLNALPIGLTAPSIGAEPDGTITVGWYNSPQKALSISISPENDLHYAAIIGLRRIYGTEPFFGTLPRAIHELICLVIA